MTAQRAATVERISAPPTRFSPAWLAERFQGVGLHVAVIGLTAAWMVPAVGLLVSSFRPFTAITSTGWWTALAPPFNYTLDNYAKVLSSSNLGHSLFNSFMISIPATVIPAAVAAFAAYAFSWMKFPGRNWLFLALVGLLAVPLQLSFVPVLKVYNAIGLTPTNWGFVGVWLAHTGYGLPFAIYLLANFFRALPSDLFESAEIDGAGTLTVFFRIVLPLSVPALASLIIFQFLWVWNDFLVALIYVGGAANVAPVTVTLANLTNSLGQGYHLLTAAAFISMIIPLVVFVSLQRYFVRGILAGSVKG
jgi:alpha-glucoside transport system permease protein